MTEYAPPGEPKKEEPEETKTPEVKATDDPRMGSRLATRWEEVSRLAQMLTYCRPAWSKSERKFIKKYITPEGMHYDHFGNYYKRIGDAPVLWSSHTDTVHHRNGFQNVDYWVEKNGDTFLGVGKGSTPSGCLGADDTSGVWMMLEMIRHKIPGLYVFHRAEEIGRKGSTWIAEKTPELLKDIKFAIAFDRRGENSIITYQSSRRCCSDDFAKNLAEQLDMGHKGDDTGAYTDTASYVNLVAECTNISVGYEGAHTAGEKQNLDYLFKLRDAVLKLDLTKLVESRKPGENTYKTYSYSGHRGNGYWNGGVWRNGSWFDDLEEADAAEQAKKDASDDKNGVPTGRDYLELNRIFGSPDKWRDLYEWNSALGKYVYIKRSGKKGNKTDLGVTKMAKGARKKNSNAPREKQNNMQAPDYRSLVHMIKQNPEIIADLLEMDGYCAADIQDHIFQCYGIL